MRSFKIEFVVMERSKYYATVEAETPEEALNKFRENPEYFDSDQEDMIDSDNVPGSEECVGEWIEDAGDDRFSSLQRFDEPIK